MGLLVIDVVIVDGKNAKSRRGGEVYKIKSITLGMGKYRKTLPWTKDLLPGAECRAEIPSE